jgi:tRNA (uracil-5-)-methyltransferase
VIMHQMDTFCALAAPLTTAQASLGSLKSSEVPLKAPHDAPLAMEAGQAVVEEPASMQPVDALAAAAGRESKGRIVPEEDRMEVMASHEAVERLKSEDSDDEDGHESYNKPKDVAERVEIGEEADGFVKRPVDPAIAKTSLCSYFRKKGCNHGENCKFAHGESELQMRPDGTWDPTSERCKKKEEKDENEDAKGEESRYRKCLVNVPMSWSQQKLKSFLDQNVSI